MKRWPIMRLGDVVLPAQQRDPRQNPGEEFCYVDIAGVDNEAKTIVVTQRIVGADAPSRARKVIRRGDVIVSTVRPNLNAVALVPDNLDNQICSTGFSVLSPSSKVTSGYLFAFVRSTSFIECLVARTTGANYPAVNDGEVKDVPIPVPPLAEQERIVKLLDEADELRKLRAQADRRTTTLIPSLFHEMFGDMGLKPGRWPTERLGRLATIEATLVDPRVETYQGLPHIGSDRIERDSGNLLASKSAREDGLISAKFVFDERDVLYSKIRPNLRKAALPIGRGLCSADIYPIRPGPKLLREFLWAYLLTDHFTDRAVDLSARANMPKLNRVQLDSIESPVPPLTLQKEFAARVSEIRAMQTEQAASRRRLENLFQSMLHRAFKGEL